MEDVKKLKTIALKRLKTVDILMKAEDWELATYIMGYVLECALKAMVCKTLRLTKYPDVKIAKGVFITHKFDRLLLVSGMTDIFSDRGPAEAWFHWGQFVNEYKGEWTGMRYELGKRGEQQVKNLYTHLTDTNGGILEEIKKRW